MTTELRQRTAVSQTPVEDPVFPSTLGLKSTTADTAHPAGEKKYGRAVQGLRQLSFGAYFVACVLAICLTQLVGAPLYWINRELFYSYMSLTKAYFGICITTMTKWWGPTTIRISGDASVAGQIRKTADGRVEFGFPERLILIANHQIYTDWLYLWWVAYANDPQTHGWLFIILKESLKYIPVIGTGMMFYGFIFMSRKMAVDRPRLAHRLKKLKVGTVDQRNGLKHMSPMWLLLFPEGTNASGNGRAKSARWAEKTGVKDVEHVLLPRSAGMYFCLSELKSTIDYVYDCTVAYEGIPRGHFGEDYFTLSSTYFQGRPPKSVNFYWRRFRMADIPLDSHEAFDVWLRERWYEKDALMEEYLSKGRFPSTHRVGAKDATSQPEYIETEVRNRWTGEVLQIFIIPGMALLAWKLASKAFTSIAAACA